MEGGPQSAPFKESRQFYFGSLLRDIIILLREWPHLPFEPASAAEMTPRMTVTEAAGNEEFVDGPACAGANREICRSWLLFTDEPRGWRAPGSCVWRDRQSRRDCRELECERFPPRSCGKK